MKPAWIFTLLAASAHAETALTIYNRNLAAVRETFPLELKSGIQDFRFDRATSELQPDSVVLRDPKGQFQFQILEQGYRNDPVSRAMLLSQFEGKELEFRQVLPDGKIEIVTGKVIRSGYIPGGGAEDPMIEVDGKIRFELPGQPLFPNLGDDTILRPTLNWTLNSAADGKFDCQLSYLSQGFEWQADYNLVAPEKGETVTLTGWVTVRNFSGTAFDNAKVKLVAGKVNILEPRTQLFRAKNVLLDTAAPADAFGGGVQQKAFDDFHLYSLPRPLTIRDKESKQIEFLRSPSVKATKKYVYAPASYRFSGGLNHDPIGTPSFPKDVAVYWDFQNRQEDGLGIPLPAGRIRFYRNDDQDGNLEFIGENQIDHTPNNEKLSIFTGTAFDLVGERRITDFQSRQRENWIRESVEVIVKNRSKEPRTILVREPLWRWSTWKIENASQEFTKLDAQNIEFSVTLQPDEEKKVTYTAHYTW